MTLDTMVALEHQGWDALCGQTGGPFYGSLMTEDALMVLVNGLAMDKKAVVESPTSPLGGTATRSATHTEWLWVPKRQRWCTGRQLNGTMRRRSRRS